MRLINTLFLSQRLFITSGAIVCLFLVAFLVPVFFVIAQLTLLFVLSLIIFDAFLLYSPKSEVIATRLCGNRFSNGDDNLVQLVLESRYAMLINVHVIDEVPVQFQRRDIDFAASLKPRQTQIIEYHLRPVKRGVYNFSLVRVFVSTSIGLLQRRFNCDSPKSVQVFPSFLQLQKYELMAISNNLTELGIKKVRKIGHNIEFEHIKEYVVGDDYRTINWKATARRNDLMVNLYQDEKSQNVYSLIDKGRLMQMPFEGMSLLDYAINSSLILSNVAIKKEDKAGVMTFEKGFDGFLPASRARNQMHQILHFLYNQKTTFGETDFSNLYVQLKHRIKRRSLLLLYTNFESIHSLDRQLPFFQQLAKYHLLVVIFFKNTELDSLVQQPARNTQGLYQRVIAEQFAFEKIQVVKTLMQHGIQAVLTKPQALSVSVINKYIELKARQLI